MLVRMVMAMVMAMVMVMVVMTICYVFRAVATLSPPPCGAEPENEAELRRPAQVSLAGGFWRDRGH
eukprot:7706800-Pyramimonas_sp.AAC.1